MHNENAQYNCSQGVSSSGPQIDFYRNGYKDSHHLFFSLTLCIKSFLLNPFKFSLNNLDLITSCLNFGPTEKKCFKAYTNDAYLFFQNIHKTQEN